MDVKVYVLEWDNGEAYSDNYTEVREVFSTREGALRYLESMGYTYEQCESHYHNGYCHRVSYRRPEDRGNPRTLYDGESYSIHERVVQV